MDPLVLEAADGSESAWYKIVEILGPTVTGFGRARGATDPDALAQDVFLDAARNIKTFSGEWPAFRSWIFTIAYRRLTDDRRKAGRQVKTAPESSAWHQPDSGLLPEQLVIQKETVDELIRALDCLKPIERDVLLLRVIGELSADEVADVVGKTPGNVRVIQNRAIKRMQKNLKKVCNENHYSAIAPVT